MEEFKLRIKASEFRASFLSSAMIIIDKHTQEIQARRNAFVKKALSEVTDLSEAIVGRDISTQCRAEVQQAIDTMQSWMDSKISLLDTSLKSVATEADFRLSNLENTRKILSLKQEIELYEKTIERFGQCCEALIGEKIQLETRKVSLMITVSGLRKTLRALGMDNLRLYTSLSEHPSFTVLPTSSMTPSLPTPVPPLCSFLPPLLSATPPPFPDVSKWHTSLHSAKQSLHILRKRIRETRRNRSEVLQVASELESFFVACMDAFTARGSGEIGRKCVSPARRVTLKRRVKSLRSQSVTRVMATPKTPEASKGTQPAPFQLKSAPITDIAILLSANAALKTTLLLATIRSRSRNGSMENSPSP